MIKKHTRPVLVVSAVAFIGLGLAGGCLFLCLLDSNDRKRGYETPDATGDKKRWFVEAFMPGVNSADVLTLSYARTGGREPPYLGMVEMTPNGVAQLRANTKPYGTGRTTGREYMRGGVESEVARSLAAHVKGWSMDESQEFEMRYVCWKGDHTSWFLIPRDGTVVYVEAVIH